MTAPRIECFADFWPYYVGAHRNPKNRALHYVGTSSAVLCALGGLATGSVLLVLSAPVVGYGPAWIGHFLLEGNKPATFGYPRYSLMADFKMLGLALRGKMGAEVTRLFGSSAPGRDAPMLATR